jgi:predicted anti-sigma-YlaC factor YlaD
MSPCSEFADRLARAAEIAASDATDTDADIDPALAAHLQTCDRCRAALEDQRQVRAMLAARPALTASPAMRVRIRVAVERERGLIGGIDFRRWTWRLVPIAAAILLLTVFGVPQPTGETTTEISESSDLPVSAVLYASDVSDASALTLMLRANADERLGNYVEPAIR